MGRKGERNGCRSGAKVSGKTWREGSGKMGVAHGEHGRNENAPEGNSWFTVSEEARSKETNGKKIKCAGLARSGSAPEASSLSASVRETPGPARAREVNSLKPRASADKDSARAFLSLDAFSHAPFPKTVLFPIREYCFPFAGPSGRRLRLAISLIKGELCARQRALRGPPRGALKGFFYSPLEGQKQHLGPLYTAFALSRFQTTVVSHR